MASRLVHVMHSRPTTACSNILDKILNEFILTNSEADIIILYIAGEENCPHSCNDAIIINILITIYLRVELWYIKKKRLEKIITLLITIPNLRFGKWRDIRTKGPVLFLQTVKKMIGNATKFIFYTISLPRFVSTDRITETFHIRPRCYTDTPPLQQNGVFN